MTDMDSKHEQNTPAGDTNGTAAKDQAVAQGRRRLIKIGAASVPVVLTLASKPVLAWHCKSPSAWGSEQINPNTSLINNPGHASYPDETWTITNWKNNSSRSGVSGKPWDKLKAAYPAIYDASTKTNGVFDYTKVTVAKLFAVIPTLGRPSGLSDTSTVKTILGSSTDLVKFTLCAQLNYLLLSPLGTNEMESCINFNELKKMASGIYTPPSMPTVTWNSTDIVNYLNNNWYTRAS